MKSSIKKKLTLGLAIVSVCGICSVGAGFTYAAFSKTTEISQQVFVQGSHLIYFSPGVWDTASAVFFVHAWNDGSTQTTWVEASKDPTNTYWIFDFDTSTYNNLLFARVKPDHNETPRWDTDVWNKTEDLTAPTNRNVLYSISGWGEDGKPSPGSWSAGPF